MAGATAAIAGCKTVETEPRVEYRTAKVAVSAPCVVNRPTEPAAMRDYIPQEQWDTLAPGAKAQATKAQAGERLNYEDALEASTSGCKEGSPPAASTSSPENLLPDAHRGPQLLD